MACFCASGAAGSGQDGAPTPATERRYVFGSARSGLHTIFEGELRNHHRITLQDWTERLKASERHLARKLANCSTARTDLYQILALFFVFQGVVLTAVAQASQLKCHNWIFPFLLCLLSSIAAFAACLQKLWEMSAFREQHRLERAVYTSLINSIDRLKDEGTSFDLESGQPTLTGRYINSDTLGEGSFDNLCSALSQFCSVWILSYAGAVLSLLSLFSLVTLLSVHQILCNPGH